MTATKGPPARGDATIRAINAAIAARHGHRGPPGYEDFPDFRSGAHQQYHITHIYRAYLGGLRLMSSLAVHNPGLEYGMGWLTCGRDGRAHARTTPDLAVVEAHVEVMRELAAHTSDWMEIAYTPSEAREIIGKNKLAVVLGIEVPQLGRPEDGSVADQIERLARLGIRQVTPIHALDNALGGAPCQDAGCRTKYVGTMSSSRPSGVARDEP